MRPRAWRNTQSRCTSPWRGPWPSRRSGCAGHRPRAAALSHGGRRPPRRPRSGFRRRRPSAAARWPRPRQAWRHARGWGSERWRRACRASRLRPAAAAARRSRRVWSCRCRWRSIPLCGVSPCRSAGAPRWRDRSTLASPQEKMVPASTTSTSVSPTPGRIPSNAASTLRSMAAATFAERLAAAGRLPRRRRRQRLGAIDHAVRVGGEIGLPGRVGDDVAIGAEHEGHRRQALQAPRQTSDQAILEPMHPGPVGKEAHRAVDLQPTVPQAVDDDVAGGLPGGPVRARHAHRFPAAARGR